MIAHRVFITSHHDNLAEITVGYFSRKQDALDAAQKLIPKYGDDVIIEKITLHNHMTEYHKIQTLFNRDMHSVHKYLIEGEWSKPEFEFLQFDEWEFEEKIDGINIRVMFDGDSIKFAGRTDDSEIHSKLFDSLDDIFKTSSTETLETWKTLFPAPESGELRKVCLYGEGVGVGVQSDGYRYSDTVDFILFDVKVGNVFLTRETVREIATKLGLKTAPIVGRGTLHTAVSLIKQGIKSTYGDFRAEGLIARPLIELTNRFGDRIITKLKHCDFSQ